MSLLEEYVLARFSSTKDKLWQKMSSRGHLSRVATSPVAVGYLGGVDLTHG